MGNIQLEQGISPRPTRLDALKDAVRKGASAVGRAALGASIYVLGTTTTVTGTTLYERGKGEVSEIIRGGDVDEPYKNTGRPKHFDTARSVSLYHPTKPGDQEGDIYLNASNLADHAICSLSRERRHGDRDKLPPVKVAINDQLQSTEGAYPHWRVNEGETLQAWLGGNTFGQRDTTYGDATVTWSRPTGKPI